MVKVSELPTTTTTSNADNIIINQGGTTKKISKQTLASYFRPTIMIVSFNSASETIESNSEYTLRVNSGNSQNISNINVSSNNTKITLMAGRLYMLSYAVKPSTYFAASIITNPVGASNRVIDEWESSPLRYYDASGEGVIYNLLDLTNTTINEEVSLVISSSESVARDFTLGASALIIQEWK